MTLLIITWIRPKPLKPPFNLDFLLLIQNILLKISKKAVNYFKKTFNDPKIVLFPLCAVVYLVRNLERKQRTYLQGNADIVKLASLL